MTLHWADTVLVGNRFTVKVDGDAGSARELQAGLEQLKTAGVKD